MAGEGHSEECDAAAAALQQQQQAAAQDVGDVFIDDDDDPESAMTYSVPTTTTTTTMPDVDPPTNGSHVSAGMPSQSIHRPATLHVRRDATWLCSVAGCCRPSGRMANFADGTAVLVCCELCLGGSHTEECEASSALWRRRQQRLRRRQQESVEPDDGVVPEGPPTGDRARHGLSELALLVGMEHAVHGLERLEVGSSQGRHYPVQGI